MCGLLFCSTAKLAPDSYCTQKVVKHHLQYSPCYYNTTVIYTGHLVGSGSKYMERQRTMETKYTGIYTYFSEKTTFVDLKKINKRK